MSRTALPIAADRMSASLGRPWVGDLWHVRGDDGETSRAGAGRATSTSGTSFSAIRQGRGRLVGRELLSLASPSPRGAGDVRPTTFRVRKGALTFVSSSNYLWPTSPRRITPATWSVPLSRAPHWAARLSRGVASIASSAVSRPETFPTRCASSPALKRGWASTVDRRDRRSPTTSCSGSVVLRNRWAGAGRRVPARRKVAVVT